MGGGLWFTDGYGGWWVAHMALWEKGLAAAADKAIHWYSAHHQSWSVPRGWPQDLVLCGTEGREPDGLALPLCHLLLYNLCRSGAVGPAWFVTAN